MTENARRRSGSEDNGQKGRAKVRSCLTLKGLAKATQDFIEQSGDPTERRILKKLTKRDLPVLIHNILLSLTDWRLAEVLDWFDKAGVAFQPYLIKGKEEDSTNEGIREEGNGSDV